MSVENIVLISAGGSDLIYWRGVEEGDCATGRNLRPQGGPGHGV